jgi:hypothetical protein
LPVRAWASGNICSEDAAIHMLDAMDTTLNVLTAFFADVVQQAPHIVGHDNRSPEPIASCTRRPTQA